MINNKLKLVSLYDNYNGERFLLSAPADLDDEKIEGIITQVAYDDESGTKEFFDALAKFGIEEVTTDISVVAN